MIILIKAAKTSLQTWVCTSKKLHRLKIKKSALTFPIIDGKMIQDCYNVSIHTCVIPLQAYFLLLAPITWRPLENQYWTISIKYLNLAWQLFSSNNATIKEYHCQFFLPMCHHMFRAQPPNRWHYQSQV